MNPRRTLVPLGALLMVAASLMALREWTDIRGQDGHDRLLLANDEVVGRDRYGDRLPKHAVARLGSHRMRIAEYSSHGPVFSPDGETLAVADIDYRANATASIRIWNCADGQVVQTIPTRRKSVRICLFPRWKVHRRLAAKECVRVASL